MKQKKAEPDHSDLELLIADQAWQYIRKMPTKERSRAWACVAAAVTAAGIRTSEEPEWVIATVQATLHEVTPPDVHRRMIKRTAVEMALIMKAAKSGAL